MTTPVPGHPFQTRLSEPHDPYCRFQPTDDQGNDVGPECGLPEGNARHRGLYVAVIEVHGNDLDTLKEEVENAVELIQLGEHGEDLWVEIVSPPRPRAE